MGFVLKYRAARPYQNYLRVTPRPRTILIHSKLFPNILNIEFICIGCFSCVGNCCLWIITCVTQQKLRSVNKSAADDERSEASSLPMKKTFDLSLPVSAL